MSCLLFRVQLPDGSQAQAGAQGVRTRDTELGIIFTGWSCWVPSLQHADMLEPTGMVGMGQYYSTAGYLAGAAAHMGCSTGGWAEDPFWSGGLHSWVTTERCGVGKGGCLLCCRSTGAQGGSCWAHSADSPRAGALAHGKV